MSKQPRKTPAAVKTRTAAADPAGAEPSKADADLLRALDATTRHALDRLHDISTATSKLIADMTRDAQALQIEAMERTASAAERLLRPQTPASGGTTAPPRKAPAAAGARGGGPGRRPRRVEK